MPPETCPSCGGEATEIVSGIDTPICRDCGKVDPETTHSQSLEDDKGDGSDNPVRAEALFSTEGQNRQDHPFDIEDSSDANLARLLLSGDRAAHCLGFRDDERLRTAELAAFAWENHFSHGRSMDAIVGACLYTAARESARPRPITVVAEAVETSEEAINTAYRALVSELEISVPVTGPAPYTHYLSDQLDLPNGITEEVVEVLSEDLDVSGNPAAVAAGALYLAANSRGHEVTLVDAGQAAGVAKETVWRKVSSLRELEVSDRSLIRS